MPPLDPSTTYLLTSLTSGSSQILTATIRLEHILKTQKIPFVALDIATDDAARTVWKRRAGDKRVLPGVCRNGEVLGDWNEIEAWVEEGRVREMLGFKDDPAKPEESRPVPVQPKGPVEVKTSDPKQRPAAGEGDAAKEGGGSKPEGMSRLAQEIAEKAKEMQKGKAPVKKPEEQQTPQPELVDEVKKEDKVTGKLGGGGDE